MRSTRQPPTFIETNSPPIPLKSPAVKIVDDQFPPPPYSAVIYAEVTKSHGRSGDTRNSRCMRSVDRVASRRAVAIAAVVLVVTIGLVVGLVVGLRKKPQTNVKYVFVPSTTCKCLSSTVAADISLPLKATVLPPSPSPHLRHHQYPGRTLPYLVHTI